ncbi:MAG TPA: c-type cytochrome [Pyrinomonadaceae bacterium]|nr:c-type cytochrome [Pyrinomonadaceae bacterium]
MESRGKRAAAGLTLLLLPAMLGVVSRGGYGGRLAGASAAQKKLTGKQLERAKVLYADNCARCHGADGRAQTAMGRAFAAPNLADAGWWKKTRPDDKRLTASLRHGRGRMPGFGRQFSTAEIDALAAFARTFNGK